MLPDRLVYLWSIEQIRQLAYSYAFAVGTQDWALLEALWIKTTERARTDARCAVRAGICQPAHRPTRLDAARRQSSHRLRWAGSATGSVYCRASMDREIFVEQAIIYLDHYERHDDVWLFRTREHLLWWGVEQHPNPMRQPSAHWPASAIGTGDAFDILSRRRQP